MFAYGQHMKQSRARTQRGGNSTAVTYSLCDQTCVYSMECPPPLFLSFVCMGAGLCGRQVFLCFIVSVPCIEFRLSDLGTVPLEPSLWPHVPFSPLALRHSLKVCLLTSLPVFFPYSRSLWMITLDCSQPCRISPSGKGSD